MSTGYLFDERFLGHDTGERLIPLPAGGTLEPVEHSSSARITRRSHALIAGSGLYDRLTRLSARMATPDDVALYHTRAHIDFIRDLCAAGGGMAGINEAADATPVVPASYEAAMLAVGSGMAAVDAVVAGEVDNAYALLRPPGHHAMAGESMGYCIFNNVVIAARHARHSHDLRRIMIVDWDVHNGNGTQVACYDDPDTLFISLHQEDWYPSGWGKVDDVGSGDALGRTINIPLPPGTGNQGYIEAFERVIRPIARQFRPELALVSAGQDPGMSDPEGRMMVTMDGFRSMATIMREIAEELCDGRLVAVQEGGYSLGYVPFCTLAVIEGLLGEQSEVQDPYLGGSDFDRSRRSYSPEQSQAIDAVVAFQRQFWRL